MARRTLSSRGGGGKRRVLTGNNSFGIDADLSGILGGLDDLEGAVEEAIRPMTQAAAQVLYERVKVNVAALGKVTGNLDRSIYQAYSPEHSIKGTSAEYHISWNHKKAPHGHLVEYGYKQRYKYRPDGMGPVVRAGMEGKPKPGRRATQAEKDAYYETLPTPRQIPGKAFVRSANSSLPTAMQAAREELWKRLGLEV